ncbi:MAG: zf-HC2 domain-containing protein [Acidobacteriota bacterium]
MNCEEFYDLVSERVDNRLSNDQAREFADHARKCHPCDMEYLIAATAKAVVREKVRRIPVPSDVYLSIIHSTIGSSSSIGV